MTPPQLHINLHESLSAGLLFTIVRTAPGTHGDEVAGIHGCGVSTPIAAAVAAATWGFDGDMHMPNGAMFIMGA